MGTIFDIWYANMPKYSYSYAQNNKGPQMVDWLCGLCPSMWLDLVMSSFRVIVRSNKKLANFGLSLQPREQELSDLATWSLPFEQKY